MHSVDYRAPVEQAMRRVHREQFLPAAQQQYSNEDTALPIDCGQTASQPSLVAFMTEQLHVSPQTRVLEIGTGCGYQTAILAELVREVFTIERILALAISAEARLRGMGYCNVQFRVGDGGAGWPEDAPFDAVIVTAAPPVLPAALVSQVRPGGRLIAPVGEVGVDDQRLVLVEKAADGTITEQDLGGVRFVPLVSEPVVDR